MAGLLLLLAVVWPAVVGGTSSAATIAICEVDYKFGCSKFGTRTRDVCNSYGDTGGRRLRECSTSEATDRTICLDDPAPPMWWAAASTVSAAYTLRSGEGLDPAGDPSFYAPGSLVTITLRVVAPRSPRWSDEAGRFVNATNKFRGLLLYAQDAAGNKVGEWSLPDAADYDFWQPSGCPNSVLHSGAAIKRFTNRFSWRAPDPGVGPVTFKALVKRGPANEGEFHRMQDLVLGGGKEAGDAAAVEAEGGSTWVLAKELGASCDSVCAGRGLECSADAMRTGSSPESFGAVAAALGQTCELPLVSDCSVGSPAASNDTLLRRCWYHDDERCPAAAGGGADTACGAETVEAVRRICACRGRRLLTVAADERVVAAVSAPETSGAGRRRQPRGALASTAFAAALAVLGVRPQCSFAVLVCVAVLSLALAPHGASAHNWLGTPSRSGRSASTERPCQQRSQWHIHAQVGPNQKTAIKFSTGHSGPYYIIFVAGENAEHLSDPDILELADDYIANAPCEDGRSCSPGGECICSSNTAYEPGFQRMHDIDQSQAKHASGPSGRLERRIRPTDPEWLEHPKHLNTEVWGYFLEKLKFDRRMRDKRINYESEKYPWIEGVYRYSIWGAHPRDYDIIPVTIPGFSGIGHYVAYFLWRGYSGCIDYELFDTEVEHPYGKKAVAGPSKWLPVDHCQFENYKEVATTCLPVSSTDGGVEGGASQCYDAMMYDFEDGNTENAPPCQRFGNRNQYTSQSNGDVGCKNQMHTNKNIAASTYQFEQDFKKMRMGIQTTPAISPPGVMGNNVPWDDRTCAVRSPLLVIEGTVRRSDAFSVEAFERYPQMFGRIGRNPSAQCRNTHRIFRVGGVEYQSNALMGFREALALCAARPVDGVGAACFGVSFELGEGATAVTEAKLYEPNTAVKVNFCSAASQDLRTGPAYDKYLTFLKKEDEEAVVEEGAPCTFVPGLGSSSYWACDRCTRGQRDCCKHEFQKDLGFVATRAECVFAVRSQHPYTANSVIHSPETGKCWAGFGIDGVETEDNRGRSIAEKYVTCRLFDGDTAYRALAESQDAMKDAWFGRWHATAQTPAYNHFSFVERPEQQDYHALTRLLPLRNPSWPGNRGPGVRRTLKISFAPEREATCDEYQHPTTGSRLAWCLGKQDCSAAYQPDPADSEQEAGSKLLMYQAHCYVADFVNKARTDLGQPPLEGTEVDYSEMGPPDWALDHGAIYGPRTQRAEYAGESLTYGWNCKLPVEDFETRGVVRFADDWNVINSTMITNLDSTCADKPDEYKSWSLKLPDGPGFYRVYIQSGGFLRSESGSAGENFRPASATGADHGCTIENVQLRADDFGFRAIKDVFSHQAVEKIVHTHDDVLTMQGGKYCQYLNWMIVEKLEDHRQARPALFDRVWLPSSASEAGVVWELEPTHADESIGFVSLHFDGATTPTGRAIDGIGAWTCRSRWLFDGDWCQTSSPVNTGPPYEANERTPFVWDLDWSRCGGTTGCIEGDEPKPTPFTTGVNYYNESGTWTPPGQEDWHSGVFPHPDRQGVVVSLADEACDLSDAANPASV